MEKVERRGGYRPNAGRKPGEKTSLSAYQVSRLLRKCRRWAKDRGRDLDDIVLEVLYSPQERTADRLAAYKLIKDQVTPKITEGGETDKALGPAVFLPEHHPRLSIVKTDAA